MVNLTKSGENRVIITISDMVDDSTLINFNLLHIQSNTEYNFTEVTVENHGRFDDFTITTANLLEGDYLYKVTVSGSLVESGMAHVGLSDNNTINYAKTTNERKSYQG